MEMLIALKEIHYTKLQSIFNYLCNFHIDEGNTVKKLIENACYCRKIQQYFSNSYTLKDEYCYCLTSDATIMVSYKFPIIH